MRKLSHEDMLRIAGSNGGFTVDASQISAAELRQLEANGIGQFIITNTDALTVADLCGIAESGKGSLRFEF